MKKYFKYAAVLAAGMLASCGTDSLTGSDPTIEPTTQEERVPILLSVASPSVELPTGSTRGTGTVGGVGNGENKWYGQRINVFMFTKAVDTKATTLNLTLDGAQAYYDNALMITPGTADNLIPGESTPKTIGEAMLDGGDIKYYPFSGNFDFFGYHGDDAVAADPVITKTDELWTVPFEIDGSQDLMSTKAKLTNAQAVIIGESKDYYSAKAARKEVQPVLSFDHLLTRLSFGIVAGNNNAGGWVETYYTADEAATANAALPGAVAEHGAAPANYEEKVGSVPVDPADLTAEEAAAYNATLEGAVAEGDSKNDGHQDPTKAVYVKAITVNSKTTGNMAVAWTAENPTMLTWGDATDDLELKERPAYYKTDDKTIAITTAHYNNLPEIAYYLKNNTENDYLSIAAWTALATDEEKAQYSEYKSVHYFEIADPTHRISVTDYEALATDEEKAEYNKGYCKDNFVAADANVPLIALTPTYPVMNHAYNPAQAEDPTEIGEALIVAPKTEDYVMSVTVTQNVQTSWVPTNPGDPPADWVYPTEEKEQTYTLNIPVPVDDPATDEDEAGFQANHSYLVKLTVYGFERIVVTTEIIAWEDGGTIPVGQD